MSAGKVVSAALTLVLLCLAGGLTWLWFNPQTEPSPWGCPVPVIISRKTAPLWPTGASLGGAVVPVALLPLPFDLTDDETSVAETVLSATGYEDALARGAAVASGLTQREDIEAFVRRVAAVAYDLGPEVAGETETARAQALLTALHRHVFRVNDPSQPLPTVTLETGRYNCVSSSIVYNLFASRMGLKTSAVAEPDHVYSMIVADQKLVAVSTTSPVGFGREIPLHEAIGVRRFIAGHEREAIPNATLFGIAVEDRLAFKLDDVVANAAEDDVTSLATQAALWRRIILFEPGYHTAHQTYERLLRKLGARLEQLNRAPESFAIALRTMKAAFEGVPEDVADAGTDLTVATTHYMEALIAQGRPDEAVAVFSQARAAAKCDEGKPCDALETDVRELLIEAVQGGQDRDWALGGALAKRAPVAEVDVTLAVAALAEADRRLPGDGTYCIDRFLTELASDLNCDSQAQVTCRVIAKWAVLHISLENPRRGAWWAKLWVRQ